LGNIMSTIINATTTNGVVIQPDNSGSLELQTNSGTTALTIDTSQRAAFVAGTAALPAITTTGDTNTGIFFSAADTIDFAEGGAAVGQFDSSANFKFNSGYGSVATAYGCRAWVNFNGIGTVSIRGSGNVTSITDNGAGDYTVNFTTAMPDVNYSAPVSVDGSGVVTGAVVEVRSYATGSIGIRGMNPQAAYANADFGTFSVAIFR
jgi:hypothetical protein